MLSIRTNIQQTTKCITAAAMHGKNKIGQDEQLLAIIQCFAGDTPRHLDATVDWSQPPT